MKTGHGERLEDWKNGGVEDRKNGRLEGIEMCVTAFGVECSERIERSACVEWNGRR